VANAHADPGGAVRIQKVGEARGERVPVVGAELLRAIDGEQERERGWSLAEGALLYLTCRPGFHSRIRLTGVVGHQSSEKAIAAGGARDGQSCRGRDDRARDDL